MGDRNPRINVLDLMERRIRVKLLINPPCLPLDWGLIALHHPRVGEKLANCDPLLGIRLVDKEKFFIEWTKYLLRVREAIKNL